MLLRQFASQGVCFMLLRTQELAEGCGAAPRVVLLDFGRSAPCTEAWEMEEEEEELRALLLAG